MGDPDPCQSRSPRPAVGNAGSGDEIGSIRTYILPFLSKNNRKKSVNNVTTCGVNRGVSTA